MKTKKRSDFSCYVLNTIYERDFHGTNPIIVIKKEIKIYSRVKYV